MPTLRIDITARIYRLGEEAGRFEKEGTSGVVPGMSGMSEMSGMYRGATGTSMLDETEGREAFVSTDLRETALLGRGV